MNPIDQFNAEKQNNISAQGNDKALQESAMKFMLASAPHKYTYNFSWMGRPVIQYPQDILAMQELVWEIKPDLIIETGIAHGGSLVFYASMLELLGGEGRVLGIDIDIRPHNRQEIENHPMSKRIDMLEGSSIDETLVAEVAKQVEGKKRVMVCLDSNHTHDHVLRELQLYSPFVTKDSYLVVFDTLVEDLPTGLASDRPWGKDNNPKTAVWEFLSSTNNFEINHQIDAKLLISVAPHGFLKRVN